ncbi:MAG: GSCFA domain-containing protein [Bacteroidetes bacterium]|nr:GSCFA domain-containing protein [Bacteroidota bacterium]
MQLTTPVQIPAITHLISDQKPIALTGSCFAESIGEKFRACCFRVCVNPFGIVYNPAAMFTQLQLIASNTKFSKADLLLHDGLYHSMMHHGSFSHPDPEKALQTINLAIENAREIITEAGILIITTGTSMVYRYAETGKVVSNCHKIPAARFERFRLTHEEIVAQWKQTRDALKILNPDLRFLFTVSPVRHLKDGAHGNQLNKAVLLLAIDQICKSDSDAEYFPSYEIFLDELRDYRFCADDMSHPNALAVKYIWEKFSTSCIEPQLRQKIAEIEKIHKLAMHRPLHTKNSDSDEAISKAILRLKQLSANSPGMDTSALESLLLQKK